MIPRVGLQPPGLPPAGLWSQTSAVAALRFSPVLGAPSGCPGDLSGGCQAAGYQTSNKQGNTQREGGRSLSCPASFSSSSLNLLSLGVSPLLLRLWQGPYECLEGRMRGCEGHSVE